MPHLEMIEQYIQSKTGIISDCEDRILLTEHFAVIADGATTKSDYSWGDRSGGSIAAELVCAACAMLAADCTAPQAFDLISAQFRHYYDERGILETSMRDPAYRIGAGCAIFSLARREVWLLDTQCRIGAAVFYPQRRIDVLLAEVRALYLETELLQGKTVAQLQSQDTGREVIFPMLQRQLWLQNNSSAGSYAYAVIDGTPIDPQAILIVPVPPSETSLILSSDGYPFLEATLAESERRLAEILERDPMLMREYKSTKGMKKGQVSFDDRSYLRLHIIED